MSTRFFEDAKRSLLKSISFRILVLTSDAIIIFTITHRYDLTLGVMIATNASSTVLYYIHERLWNGVHFGKTKQKPVETALVSAVLPRKKKRS